MKLEHIPYCASGSKTHSNTLAGKVDLDIIPRGESVTIGVSVPSGFFTVQYRLSLMDVARLSGFLEEYLKRYMPTRVGGEK